MNVVIFGDIHGSWDRFDLPYYQSLKADLVLFTGDIGGRNTQPILKDLKQIGPNVAGILGNHDGAIMPHVIAEALGQQALANTFAQGHIRRVRELRQLLGHTDVGFKCRDFNALGVSLIGMRPHSTGGGRHHFPETLRQVYKVKDALAQHKSNLTEAAHQDLILLGHNGPFGLGNQPNDPFGVDFRGGGGDHGDPDYGAALAHAAESGQRVLFAVGGHMHDVLHRKSRHLGVRTTIGFVEGVLVVNACRIARITRRGRYAIHRHVEVQVDRDQGRIQVEDVSWSPPNQTVERKVVFAGDLLKDPSTIDHPSLASSPLV